MFFIRLLGFNPISFAIRISSFPSLHFFFASSHSSCLYAIFYLSPKNFSSHNLMKSPTSASSRLFLHFFLSCPASKSMFSVRDFQLRIGQVQDFFRYMDIIVIPAQNLFRLVKPVQQSCIFHIAFILLSEKKTARAVRLRHSFSLFELQFWEQSYDNFIGRGLLCISIARKVGTGSSSLSPQKHLSFSLLIIYHCGRQLSTAYLRKCNEFSTVWLPILLFCRIVGV